VLDGPIGAVQRALEAQRVPGSDLRRQVVHTVARTPAAGYLGDVAVRVLYLAEQSEAGQTRELGRGHGQLHGRLSLVALGAGQSLRVLDHLFVPLQVDRAVADHLDAGEGRRVHVLPRIPVGRVTTVVGEGCAVLFVAEPDIALEVGIEPSVASGISFDVACCDPRIPIHQNPSSGVTARLP